MVEEALKLGQAEFFNMNPLDGDSRPNRETHTVKRASSV